MTKLPEICRHGDMSTDGSVSPGVELGSGQRSREADGPTEVLLRVTSSPLVAGKLINQETIAQVATAVIWI